MAKKKERTQHHFELKTGSEEDLLFELLALSNTKSGIVAKGIACLLTEGKKMGGLDILFSIEIARLFNEGKSIRDVHKKIFRKDFQEGTQRLPVSTHNLIDEEEIFF